jgi:signal transduction histidine kinase
MEPTSNQPSLQLATLIERNYSEIERRWLEQVQAQVSHKPGVELTHLRDGLPDYLRALVRLLRGAEEIEERAEPAWSKVAREHGITRVRIGFDISQLIQEFIVLRHVIQDVAREQGLVQPPDALLADVLDQAITASVSAYVDARDYQARQKQAENIGFLTHEFKNPLSNAMLAAARMRQHATAEQQRLLETLNRNHARLAELIDSVLLSEKLAVGKVEYQPAEVKLEQVMTPALEAARAAAAHKGLGFSVNYDRDLRVRLDPALTRSAIQNLADNAAKYTDRGSVAISVDDAPDELVIHVRDSCEGISKEELRTIFEPFERGTTGKSGTGLGLAIAKRAVQAQGGSIHAESREAAGCHFWISLPKRAT